MRKIHAYDNKNNRKDGVRTNSRYKNTAFNSSKRNKLKAVCLHDGHISLELWKEQNPGVPDELVTLALREKCGRCGADISGLNLCGSWVSHRG